MAFFAGRCFVSAIFATTGRSGYNAGMRWTLAVLVAVSSLAVAPVLTGCRGCEAGPPGLTAGTTLPSASASVAPSAQRPPPPLVLAPLRAASDMLTLEVPKHGAAVVSVPRGATQPRPLVIVLHGDSDRPEARCRQWREISGGYPWVICPRGKELPNAAPDDRRYSFGSLTETTHELRAALAALKQQYTDHLAPGSVVMVGIGRGADIAARIARQEPSFFSRLVLTEGGADQWTSSTVTLFQRGGGKRVLLVCGQVACLEEAEARRNLSERLGILARVAAAAPSERPDDAALAAAVKKEYKWLVTGDARFAPHVTSSPRP